MPVPGGGARPASVPEYSWGWGGLQLPQHIRCTFFVAHVWCTCGARVVHELHQHRKRKSSAFIAVELSCGTCSPPHPSAGSPVLTA